jgi:hypothetical protein
VLRRCLPGRRSTIRSEKLVGLVLPPSRSRSLGSDLLRPLPRGRGRTDRMASRPPFSSGSSIASQVSLICSISSISSLVSSSVGPIVGRVHSHSAAGSELRCGEPEGGREPVSVVDDPLLVTFAYGICLGSCICAAPLLFGPGIDFEAAGETAGTNRLLHDRRT